MSFEERGGKEALETEEEGIGHGNTLLAPLRDAAGAWEHSTGGTEEKLSPREG